MLSDPWFRDNVARIIVEELLCIDRSWFAGKAALDAGCGLGRWTIGLLSLGCHVLAVDASPAALEALREHAERLAPDAWAKRRLETSTEDLLNPSAELTRRKFDLVFSFGVLHHTGDTCRALSNMAALVAEDGVLFLYLYGARSVSLRQRVVLWILRWGLAFCPFAMKVNLLRRLRPGRDPHQAFDLFSPVINDRLEHEIVVGWLRELGFTEIVRTIDHTEIYLRARRFNRPPVPTMPLAQRPYWFERYGRSTPRNS
jgi:SAM-dependent methyltransferase